MPSPTASVPPRPASTLNRRVQTAAGAHSFGNNFRWTLVAFVVTAHFGLGALGLVSAAGLAGQGAGFLAAGSAVASRGPRRLLGSGAAASLAAQAVLLACLLGGAPLAALVAANLVGGVALQIFGMAAKSAAVTCAEPGGVAAAVAGASAAANVGSYAGAMAGAVVWALGGLPVEAAGSAVLLALTLTGVDAGRRRHWSAAGVSADPDRDAATLAGPGRVMTQSWRLLGLAFTVAVATTGPMMLLAGIVAASVGAVWVAPASAVAAVASVAVIRAARRLGDPTRVEVGLISGCALGAGAVFAVPDQVAALLGAVAVATFCSVLAGSRLEALIVGRSSAQHRPLAQSMVAAAATFGSAVGAWTLPVMEATAAHSSLPHPSPLEAATLAFGVGGALLVVGSRHLDRRLRRAGAWLRARDLAPAD